MDMYRVEARLENYLCYSFTICLLIVPIHQVCQMKSHDPTAIGSNSEKNL